MSKYVIKNCPCFFEENEEVNDYTCSWCGTEELACQDCTDCVMKQIVELCEEDLKPVREWQEGDTVFIEYKKDAHLANNILQLLQIKEVE